MNNPVDRIFARLGRPLNPTSPGPACPSDEAFAAYLDPAAPAREREAIELHSLACGDCHDLLRMVVDLTATVLPVGAAAMVESARPAPQPVGLRIVGRLAQRGIELLNRAELTLLGLGAGGLVPVLGRTRETDAPVADSVAIQGPGSGLDELELQLQPNGTAKLFVRCRQMPDLAAGELASIVLDVDGAAREKRPYAGEEISFAPIGRGNYRVRLVARAPGGPARPLAEATLELLA